jgi:hypothetical protein
MASGFHMDEPFRPGIRILSAAAARAAAEQLCSRNRLRRSMAFPCRADAPFHSGIRMYSTAEWTDRDIR